MAFFDYIFAQMHKVWAKIFKLSQNNKNMKIQLCISLDMPTSLLKTKNLDLLTCWCRDKWYQKFKCHSSLCFFPWKNKIVHVRNFDTSYFSNFKIFLNPIKIIWSGINRRWKYISNSKMFWPIDPLPPIINIVIVINMIWKNAFQAFQRNFPSVSFVHPLLFSQPAVRSYQTRAIYKG